MNNLKMPVDGFVAMIEAVKDIRSRGKYEVIPPGINFK